jgi:hypothetical protein
MTYKTIQNKVKDACGFVPKTCWIADVKEKLGFSVKKAPNRIDSNKRMNPCPAAKFENIKSVILRGT